jgi:hypothetical protein
MSDADPRLHVLVDDRDRDARAVLRITASLGAVSGAVVALWMLIGGGW